MTTLPKDVENRVVCWGLLRATPPSPRRRRVDDGGEDSKRFCL